MNWAFLWIYNVNMGFLSCAAICSEKLSFEQSVVSKDSHLPCTWALSVEYTRSRGECESLRIPFSFILAHFFPSMSVFFLLFWDPFCSCSRSGWQDVFYRAVFFVVGFTCVLRHNSVWRGLSATRCRLVAEYEALQRSLARRPHHMSWKGLFVLGDR